MNFIPDIHFRSKEEKATPEWFLECSKFFYHNGGAKSLLHGKDIAEVEGYSSGNQDMEPFKKMFRSLVKRERKKQGNMVTDKGYLDAMDFEPFSILSTPINSAVTTVQKLPIEVTCTAVDGLARDKMEKDKERLRNKRLFEKDTVELAAKLNIEKIDVGGVQNNASGVDELPMGLDPEDADDQELYFKMLYRLRPESAFETLLESEAYIKKVQMIKDLEIRDQLKWGISCHRSFKSDTTGLPDVEYVHPANVNMPYSHMQDSNDVPFYYITKSATISELYNYCGSKFTSKEDFQGYLAKWGSNNNVTVPAIGDWQTHTMTILYIEFKSVDYMNLDHFMDSKGKENWRIHPDQSYIKKEKNIEQIYSQQTYGCYWLPNSDLVYNYGPVEGTKKDKGMEVFANYTLHTYRSQPKSPVELAIPECKSVQRAWLKLQHLIIKSKPPGAYLDLKFLRSALETLEETNAKKTMTDLLNMFFEDNVMIGDTAKFNGKNDANFKPFEKIAGGLDRDAAFGYFETIAKGIQSVARITGINDQVTGAAPTPEGLVGLQKLLIQQSVNAIYYLIVAIKEQYSKLYNHWAQVSQSAIAGGGRPKEAILRMIGEQKVAIIEGLNEIPLHQFVIKVEVTQRELERETLQRALRDGKTQGVFNAADEFIINRIQNPKDAFAYLMIREKKAKQEKAKQAQMMAQIPQQVEQQKGQNLLQLEQAKTQGEIMKIQAQGKRDVDVEVALHRLGLNASDLTFQQKRILQSERGQQQLDKSIQTAEQKANLEAQAV